MNLTPREIDALKELINIGVGRAARMLNQMVHTRVHLQVPLVKVFSSMNPIEEMDDFGNDRLATVRLTFKGPFSGTAALIFPSESASRLVAVLRGEKPESPDLDAVRAGTLGEVGNILINGVMGSIGNVLKKRIDYSIPFYLESSVTDLLRSAIPHASATVVLVRTRFRVEKLQVEGNIILLFEVASFEALLAAINVTILNAKG